MRGTLNREMANLTIAPAVECDDHAAPSQERYQYEATHSPYYAPTPPLSSQSSLLDRLSYHYEDLTHWMDIKPEAGSADAQDTSDMLRIPMSHHHAEKSTDRHPLGSEWTSSYP